MISVCVATYNGEAFIQEQLNSILSQLSENDEVIVSDDGSTDNTLLILDQFQDKRLRILRNNVGVNSSGTLWDNMARIRRNFELALQHAKGNLIFLSDQDDVWNPGKVQCVLDSIRKDAMCVVHDCEIVDSNLQPSSKTIFSTYHPFFCRYGWLWKSPFMGCCMVVRREVLDRALPIPENVEYDTWLGVVAQKMGELQVINKPLIRYRRHGNNVSTCGQKNTNNLFIKLQRRYYIIKNIIRL
jgi:glycosyltransferase involved in cell wall biosynthesis